MMNHRSNHGWRWVLIALWLLAGTEIGFAEPALKEWTLAVFLNADNNLDACGLADEQEMAEVGSNDWLNIVTLIDREKGPAGIDYIEKGRITRVQEMGELDMGDYRQLVEFMKWTARHYPARRYILTIWNHGSGWKEGHLGPTRGISYDDSSNNHITTNQLESALAEIREHLGGRLELLNLDACLMQMAEVAHACVKHCHFLVASEETEPGDGSPFNDILARLTPDLSGEEVARLWVEEFRRSYDGGSQGRHPTTQSALRSSSYGAVFDGLEGLAKALMSGNHKPKVLAVLKKVQRFSDPANIDLRHFVTLLDAEVRDESIQTACAKLRRALDEAVIASGSTGPELKNSGGLAIYLPFDFFIEAPYPDLSFSKAGLWNEMIQFLYKGSRGAQIISDIRRGSFDSLETFARRESRQNPADINGTIVQEIKFAVFSQRAFPRDIAGRVESFLRSARLW